MQGGGLKRSNAFVAIGCAALFAGCRATSLSGLPGAAPVSSYDLYAQPGELVRVEGNRQINVRCSGSGPVTVLLEAGLGYPSYSWREVQPRIAEFTRVCSYDRAGLGFSDAGPMPRSASASAYDIGRLVESGAIKPPLLLVGGSLGGQIVRLYAFRNPEAVKGIVLVDPYAEGQYQAFAKIEPTIAQELIDLAAEEKRCVEALRGGLPNAEAERQGCVQALSDEFSAKLKAVVHWQRMSPKDYEATYSESLMLDTKNEVAMARERRDLSPMPVIILSATNEFGSERLKPVRAALLAEKAKRHRDIASISANGEVRLIDAAHVIQNDAPEAVVAAIRDALGPTTKVR
jgi:pimeloyl-ACP methyl ester carboxylesterase